MSIVFRKSAFKVSRIADIPFAIRLAFDEVDMEHKHRIVAE